MLIYQKEEVEDEVDQEGDEEDKEEILITFSVGLYEFILAVMLCS
jgi:hypothetical protein